jgi:hypothetical protein
MRTHSVWLSLALTTLMTACSVDDAALGTEDDDVESVDGKADRAVAPVAAVSATYYSITRDLRRCAAPMCGGYFVSRVNRTVTRCNDGRNLAACYVADIDLEGGLGLSADEADAFRDDIAAGRAIVRGAIQTRTVATHAVGLFVPTEAWHAATDQKPAGTLYKVANRRIVCVAAPCASFLETKLNATTQQSITDVDLTATNVGDKGIEAAMTELAEQPLLVSGENATYQVSGRNGTKLDGNQYWTRVLHEAVGE